MKVGKNIKLIRTANQISQKDLAAKLGITPNYLSMIENNSKQPSLTLLEKISQALNVPLTLIFAELSIG